MDDRGTLAAYVHDALSAGHSHDQIRERLAAAGWRPSAVSRALGRFADDGAQPPVPRPRPFVSGRDSVIYGLTFVAIAVLVVTLISFLFRLVDVFLDPLLSFDIARSAWSIAALAVFVPLVAVLDGIGSRGERDNPVRKILGYASLFFAALVILFTLVAVIALLLAGGLGVEVGLKALIVAAVSGMIFLYYRRDLAEDADPSYKARR